MDITLVYSAFVSQTVTKNLDSPLISFPTGHTLNLDSFAPETAVGVGYQFNSHWEMDLTVDEIWADRVAVNS
ncbi:MAG: hypothetical protein SFW07_03705 [Gammaproteobacteria bacterium]|nr:hypothetical protein [Gammaproteobacteria bacterium]